MRSAHLDLRMVSALLLGAGCISGSNTNETVAPTPSPTEMALDAWCDTVRLIGNGTSPMHRAPGTCWNNWETHTSDMFVCEPSGDLRYMTFDIANCQGEYVNFNNTIEEGFSPDDDLNGGKYLDEYICGGEECFVTVTYFNVTGQGCPITYMMDRSSYTLGECSYNKEIEENTLWECCEEGGVRLSTFAADDDTCSGEAYSVKNWDGDESDDDGGSACADFEQANPLGDSDIEWRCDGLTVACSSSNKDSSDSKINGTQIALIVIFTLLALAGCMYCICIGKKGSGDDAGLLAENQQADYLSSSVAQG